MALQSTNNLYEAVVPPNSLVSTFLFEVRHARVPGMAHFLFKQQRDDMSVALR